MTDCEQTRNVLGYFEAISRIPRQSKNEEAIAQFLCDWATEKGFAVKRDSGGNVIVSVAADAGYEQSPTIILQGHMDMVCEKAEGVEHDFSKDGIKYSEVDGWLVAEGTTLGADNGLGLALAMAIATDDNVKHPALELLFTQNEETGMTGAAGLQSSSVKGRILLNLDSEDEGVFTVGCAGGKETRSIMQLYRSHVPANWIGVEVVIDGLKGGHSGVDIAKGRANAIKLAARTLRALNICSPELLLRSISAGTAHNAIPRSCKFSFRIPETMLDEVSKTLKEMEGIFQAEYVQEDGIVINHSLLSDLEDTAFDRSSSEKVCDVLFSFPHGVMTMSFEIEGLVESSVNLAMAHIEGDRFKILSSQRSSVASRLDAVTNRVEALIRLAGGVALSGKGYPSWQPNMESDLLKRSLAIYEATFGVKPKVEVIHAGLECGLIGSKFKSMDMISFGPTILSPHSPSERAEIASVSKVYKFLVALLANYKEVKASE